MSFLDHLKRDLGDPRNRVDRDTWAVQGRSLHELIDAFEKLDSDARSRYLSADPGAPLEHRVHASVTALYYATEKDADLTMLVIMETLLPLMQERNRARVRQPGYRGPIFGSRA